VFQFGNRKDPEIRDPKIPRFEQKKKGRRRRRRDEGRVKS
jgi:hypothetical protein